MPMLMRAGAVSHRPLYTTLFEEYPNNTIIGAQEGWNRPSTASSVQITAYGTGNPYNQQAFGASHANSRVMRLLNLNRATSYVKATFTSFSNLNRQGVAIHGGTGTDRVWLAYVRGQGDTFLLWTAYVEGDHANWRRDLTQSVDLKLIGFDPVDDMPYTIEARATSATSFEVWLNGVFITTRNGTTGTNGFTGIFLDHDGDDHARCARFECGTHNLGPVA